MSDATSSATENVGRVGDRQFLTMLIALYHDSPELWKVKSKDYSNKKKKSIAFEKIVGVLKQYKSDFTVDKLKQKINILRTNFNKEYGKIKLQKQSGVPVDAIAQPKLWYYNDLLFIKDQAEVTKTESSEPLFIHEPQTTINEWPSPPPPPKKSKIAPRDSTEQLIDLATTYLKNNESESDIVAKAWAMKLKRLPPGQRCFAEKIINDTLFEAEMGTLTRKAVTFLNEEIHPRRRKQATVYKFF